MSGLPSTPLAMFRLTDTGSWIGYMGGGIHQFERRTHDRRQARLIGHLMRLHTAADRLMNALESVGHHTYRIPPGMRLAVRAAIEDARPAIRHMEEAD